MLEEDEDYEEKYTQDADYYYDAEGFAHPVKSKEKQK